MISDQLMEDMKAAMKAGDKVRLSVIRMLRAELKNAQIAAGQALSESQEEKVLASYARKRKEAIEQYNAGGRRDLADRENAEYEIVASYLPPELDEAQLVAIIREIIEETGASSPKDFGQVMKAVMARVAGRAEGNTVSSVVKKLLTP